MKYKRQEYWNSAIKMTSHTNQHFFVLSGAPGTGKTSIIEELKNQGYTCAAEPARQVLAHQRSTGGQGVPEVNTMLFTELMLNNALASYQQHQPHTSPVFFDRGIPDNLGYAKQFNIDQTHFKEASKQYRYNQTIFFTPCWKAIFTNDDERKMTFQAAEDFGNILKSVYLDLGYTVIDIPLVSIQERVEFVLSNSELTIY